MLAGHRVLRPVLATTLLLLAAGAAGAQQILLDRPVRAGSLTFFPDIEQDNGFRYAATRARLAQGPGGKPKFSFLYYSDQKEGGTGAQGGLLHAMVELGATQQELDDAKRELRRVNPGAVVLGPALFSSGQFGLVSNFKNADGVLTQQVVGIGAAPILEGTRATIALHLTDLGARLLWESFHGDTPDVTFEFEMRLDGYRSPKRARLVAELDRIYAHETFNQAVATTYAQGEIYRSFEDLRDQSAIRLEVTGEDAQLSKLVETAYNKLIALIFKAAPEGPKEPAERKRALELASALLDKRRSEVRAENALARAEAKAEGEKKADDAEAEDEKEADDAKEAASEDAAVARDGEPFEDLGALLAELVPELAKPSAPIEKQLPGFASVSLYEMKEVRQHGVYEVDLNKRTASSLLVRFDHNIGSLARHLDDPTVFRASRLSGPTFRDADGGATPQTPDWSEPAPAAPERIVQLEGDPGTLSDLGVTHITVRLFPDGEANPPTAELTFDVSRGESSGSVALASDGADYGYSIEWLAAGETLSSGVLRTDQDVLYLDRLP